MHIGWHQFFVAVVALASGGGSVALGFGPIRSSVVLGQPLNLAIPVALAEGETLSAECASAEVTTGDIKLPPGSVRVRITQGRDSSESVLRISTTSVVEEPVLSVTCRTTIGNAKNENNAGIKPSMMPSDTLAVMPATCWRAKSAMRWVRAVPNIHFSRR